MEKESVLNFMIKEHGELYNHLVNFVLRIENPIQKNKALDSFKQFKKEESLHVNLEENIVFIFHKKIDEIPILPVIKKQHEVLSKLIKKITEKNVQEKVGELQEFLRKHLRLEEAQLYPVLDKLLTEEQKQELFKRIAKSKELN